ncbi:unnamed protein product, partial [Effrenium voratum]
MPDVGRAGQNAQPASVERSQSIADVRALKEFRRSGQWQQALGREPRDRVSQTLLINTCVQSGHWRSAAAALSKFMAWRMEADVVMYNSLRPLTWQQALEAFAVLQLQSLQPTLVTYETALTACRTQWPCCLCLLAERSSREISAKSFTKVLAACADAFAWQQALQLLARLPGSALRADGRLRSTALFACQKAGAWAAAGAVVEEMRQAQAPCDAIAANAALDAFHLSAQWVRASLVLRGLSTPDVLSFGSVIHACVTAWETAISLLSEMRRARAGPELVTYNLALKGQLRWQLAAQLTRLPGCRADVVTVTSMMTACEGASAWREALSVLGRGEQEAVEGNICSYSAAMLAYDSISKWRDALDILATPDVVARSTCIGACEKASEWLMAVQLLKDVARDAVAVSEAISASAKASRWQMALMLLGELKPKGALGVAAYSAAMAGCQKVSQWHCVLALLAEMWLQRLQPDAVAYAALSECSLGSRVFDGMAACVELRAV